MRKTISTKILSYFKKEPVLIIASILAIVSAFITPPDMHYISYIDFRTLCILFSLMAVMCGFQKLGCFKMIASALLNKSRNLTQLLIILILLCFFFGMVITNDVALITFVPLTIAVLNLMGEDIKKKLLIPIVSIQTIAANLGSMLTPIGNPQNLYLYGLSGVNLVDFLKLMLPYSFISLILLMIWCFVKGTHSKKMGIETKNINVSTDTDNLNPVQLVSYLFLFVLCLLSVARILPYWILALIIIFTVFIIDKKVLLKVDYSLLLTFIAFFVFIGNMGRIDTIYDFLSNIIVGNELPVSIISSQVISNVPAALLLSGFTNNYTSLIIGVNLGGLGTLIASMASLISFKFVANETSAKTSKYLGYFTLYNILFLICLVAFHSFAS